MKTRILVCALAVVAAGCGGGEGSDTTAAPSTTEAAATTAAATTTEAAATSEAPTTTTEAATTTVDPLAELAAEMAAYEGGYEGTWNNTTYDSEGAFVADMSYDAAAMAVTFEVDLGGFVFGSFDPEPETFTIALADLAASAGGTMTITSSTFGEMEVSLGPDGIEMHSADVPEAGIATITVTGPVTPDGFDFAYVVEFEGGGTAEGTVTAQKTG